MKTVKRAVALVAASFFFVSVSYAADALVESKKKILIVVSNVAEHKGREASNNLWEVAPPYHVFKMHGYEVDFVSPKGGEVPFFMDPLGISSYTIKYEGFMEKSQASLKPSDVDTYAYSGVYIGGGGGPLVDVASNPDILKIMAAIYEAGGVLGAAGHGPGSLGNIRLGSGGYLVNGITMTGFPNSTEQSWAERDGQTLEDIRKLVPFFVEDRLRERGANYLGKPDLNDKHDVVEDRRVVTTMFLPSAALVAKEMIDLLDVMGGSQ